MGIVPKRAPVQGDHWLPKGRLGQLPGTISWEEHLEIYEAYRKKYPSVDQSAERIAERCGFGWGEIVSLMGHPPRTFVQWESK